MNASDSSQDTGIPNIHVVENEKVLACLKDLHPYDKIIVRFDGNKVNQGVTASDLVGYFASMTSLPGNSKYVIYGSEALVHPKTGIIFGFITSVNVIYRLPDNLLKEAREGNLINFRVMKDSGIYDMRGLEENWVSSPSITEPLVYKCYEYFGEVEPEESLVHLNYEMDLTTPRTKEFEEQARSRRLISIGVFVLACLLAGVIWYLADSLTKLH